MMDIRFRGQDKANNKWIYGNLEIPLRNQNASRCYIIGYSYGQYQKHEVDKKTVGQFTGVKDINGKDIYEGDILLIDGLTKMTVEYGEQEVEEDYGNKWRYLGWNFPINYAGYPEPVEVELEVIGNKYDNTELL